MNRLIPVLAAAGDRVNPIAVKEFRQAVQSRLVVAVLILSLLANLCIVGGYLMLTVDADSNMRGGQTVFMILLSILQFTCLAFVPLYAGVRLSLERNDANIDLLFITTITPGAIIRGKYLAATALTLLIYSACLPFVTLTYLLRGIDLPTIFYLLASSFLGCAVANAVGILAGCIPASWFMRGLIALGMLISMFWIEGITMAFASGGLYMGLGAMMSGWQFWAGVGSYLLLIFLAIGMFQVLSVALVSPKLSNRMLATRMYVLGLWLITGVLVGLWSYFEGALGPFYPWVFCSGVGLMILTALSLGERDTWTARVRARIPRNPLLRSFAFLLYTGSAGGMLWWTLMFTATMLVAWLAVMFNGGVLASTIMGGRRPVIGNPDLVDLCTNMSIVFAYILCYCLTVAFLRTFLLKSVSTTNLPVIAALLGVTICLVPYLVAFLQSRQWLDTLPWYLLGSPVVLFTSEKMAARHMAGPFVLGWLLLCVLLSARWFFGQWRRFVPYEPSKETPLVAEGQAS